jgi:hypothetical protein
VATALAEQLLALRLELQACAKIPKSKPALRFSAEACLRLCHNINAIANYR